MRAPPVATYLGHVCMNHFVLIDLRDGPRLEDVALFELARRICPSPIADDLLVLTRSDVADAQLRIFGADGREADCCGNGLLLVAGLYGAERGVTQVTIEACQGVRLARRTEHGWSVEIGPVRSLREELAPDLPEDVELIDIVRAGEPHLVIRAPRAWCPHVRRRDFERYCAALRDALPLEGGVNVTVVFEDGDERALVRTFERGARRQTYSCGTGSIAAAFALHGARAAGEHTYTICSPGGCHDVHHRDDRWELIGAPHPIAHGHLEGDALHLPITDLFDANLYQDIGP